MTTNVDLHYAVRNMNLVFLERSRWQHCIIREVRVSLRWLLMQVQKYETLAERSRHSLDGWRAGRNTDDEHAMLRV